MGSQTRRYRPGDKRLLKTIWWAYSLLFIFATLYPIFFQPAASRVVTKAALSAGFADILVPFFRALADEIRHELYASRIIEDSKIDSAGAQVFFGSSKIPVLADDDGWDPVKEYGAATHIARRECRVQYC